MTEFADLPARYSKGTLKLRQRLDLPEGAEVRVTVSTEKRSTARRGSKRKYQYPTRVVSWATLDRLTGIASLGGNAVADSEALYDHD
jgi:predicted DNA-binding antitoxin AbrB/MazE fold protein